MDLSEATRHVFNRIQKIEPDSVTKIIGYLLLQDNGDREMLRLAFAPDAVLYPLVNKAKIEISNMSAKSTISASSPTTSINSAPNSELSLQFTPFSPASSRPFSSPATLRVANSYWDQQVIHNMDFVPSAHSETISDEYCLQNQAHLSSLDDQLDSTNPSGPEFPSNYYYPETALGGLSARSSRRSPSLPEFPVKTCHYFVKGFCKHGSNCRYFHGLSAPDSFSQVFSPNQNDLSGEDHILLPGSLEKLELELMELLKSKRGVPVSIASLPLMYFEKYGRNLQAEGYLTESQRHGKAGYSLTKLLARLKNSIRLIDRPHGQHAVVLAEDAPRYMEYRSERSESGGVVAGSRQIYLTFPAESTFTEEDVSNYFKSFGPVQDVRIPCQQKRMFGFVTFVYPETVKIVLTKGNPHFVCGARVLVKPYKEKSRTIDRKYAEKVESQICYQSHFLDMDTEFHPIPRLCDSSRLLRKQFMEEHGQAIELETRRLAEVQLASKPLNHQTYYSYSMDDFKHSEDHDFPSSGRFGYLFDVINNGSTSDDHKARHSSTNYTDQDSNQGINLPESPFASSMASSISTVI